MESSMHCRNVKTNDNRHCFNAMLCEKSLRHLSSALRTKIRAVKGAVLGGKKLPDLSLWPSKNQVPNRNLGQAKTRHLLFSSIPKTRQ